MPTLERIESWRGQDVLDNSSAKAGRLEDVYYDAGGQSRRRQHGLDGLRARPSALFGVIDQVEALGLELIAVDRRIDELSTCQRTRATSGRGRPALPFCAQIGPSTRAMRRLPSLRTRVALTFVRSPLLGRETRSWVDRSRPASGATWRPPGATT
jgi:hypothetical protein